MTIAFISTLFIVASAICVAVGWWLISKRRIEAHMKVMKWAALLAIAFFIVYVSRTVIVGNTAFGGPDEVALYYQLFLIFHIILATVGAVMGLRTLYLGYKEQYEKHKKIGPYTSVVWFATAITGVMVFLFLYVIYDPGETTNVFRAIFGF